MRTLLLLLLLLSWFPCAAIAAPLINEIVAENQHGLKDSDGDYSDWIEIHNPDPAPVNLSGWHLTDDSTVMAKWTFPSVTIPGGGFLLVFASGKNRAVAGQELHTNFALNADGEYLALVQPDSVTVASLFSPAFPPQRDGYSFGVSQQAQTQNLVASTTPSYLVPGSAAALAADWKDPTMLNSAGWQSGTGTGAAGYETASVIGGTSNVTAQGAPTQSTTLSTYTANLATNAVYSDFTHTLGSDTAPFWLLTFNADQQFASVKIFNRTSCCGARLRDITVKVLNASNAVVYTTALLNPENSAYAPNGPASLDVSFIALTGAPVTGRKIRIERTPDPDFSGGGSTADDAYVLSMGEVEVRAVTGAAPTGERNLTAEAGVSASQSTTNGGFIAGLAINSNLTDFTHTVSTDTAPTWRLDLGQRRLVSKITLYNRTSCCGSRLRDITVRVKDQDNTTVTYTSPLLNAENSGYVYPNGPGELVVDFAQLTGGYVVGRYVEVTRAVDSDLSGSLGQGNADEASVLSLGEVVTIGTDYGYYTPLITTNLKTPMHTVNSSAFLRYAFTATSPENIARLKLRMRFDDGFVAYLNGVKIAERNAPATLSWNSAAVGGDRDDGAAVNFEEIDVSAFRNLLLSGNNVLAIHGLTSAAADPDFLIQPQLLAERVIVQPAATYLQTPTPGLLNSSGWFFNFVADTVFGLKRGFYTTPQSCAITTPTTGASIYYTMNGAEPSPTAGTLYTGPIPITKTTVLRARAFRDDWEPTNIDTQTYLFLSDVIAQQANGAPPTGWPASPIVNASGQSQAMNYGMDPNVRALYGDQGLIAALTQIPTISLVTEQKNLTDPLTGIYANASGHGEEWERPASIEWLDPAKPAGLQGEFQHNCGIRIRGGASRSANTTKHAFRVYFRDSYSVGKLNYPVFGPGGASEHDVIDLASSQNYSWARDNSGYDTMVRDPFARETLVATGSPGCRNRYVHVYLNGIYWGLHYFDERPIAGYGEAYFGGSKDDFDAIKTGNHNGGFITEATDGYLSALPGGGVAPWRDLWNRHRAFATAPAVTPAGNPDTAAYFAMLGRDANGVRNSALPVLVDIDSLIDYMLVIFYSGDGDAPLSSFLQNNKANNWFALRSRTRTDMGFVFFNHDAEHTFGAPASNFDRTGPFPDPAVVGATSNQNNFAYANPQWIFQDLAFSPEFRMRVADRAYKHFFNSGVMTTAVAEARMDALAAQINLAVKAHSQRWGDSFRVPAFNASDWQGAVSAARGWLSGRESAVVYQLQNYRLTPAYPVASAPLFPQIAPPTFSLPAGNVPGGQQLTISAPSGSIYYTANGADPRAVGGASAGILYSGPITLTEAITVIKARAWNGVEWSPLAEATYFANVIPAGSGNLVVSEIQYHPAAPSLAERNAGFLDADEFEFLELTNISAASVNLTGCFFDDGIDFNSGDAVIPPGGRYLLARNAAAFQLRYGVAPHALYTQKLSNSGDHLLLKDSAGVKIRDFSYGVSGAWPSEPDGFGPSLVLKAPTRNPDHSDPANWRASNSVTPGGSDALNYGAWKTQNNVASDSADGDHDGIGAFLEYAVGGNLAADSTDLLPSASRAGGNIILTIHRNLAADDVIHTIEASPNLSLWNPVTAPQPVRSTANGIETLKYAFPISTGPQRYFRARFQTQ